MSVILLSATRRLGLALRLIIAVSALTVAPAIAVAQSAAIEPAGVPVMLHGVEIYRIYGSFGMFSPGERARRLEDRLERAITDPHFDPTRLHVSNGEKAAEIYHDDQLLFVVTDAEVAGDAASRLTHAQAVVRRIAEVVQKSREAWTWQALARGFGLIGLQTVVLGVALWLLSRLRRTALRATRRIGRNRAVAAGASVHPQTFAQVLDVWEDIARLATTTAAVLAVVLWLSLALAELPWTQPAAARIFGYAAAPFGQFASGLLDYLPSLFFVLATATVTWAAIRAARFVFNQIERGNVTVENFPPDWAVPTFRLVRLLLLALALVAIYPYVPGSQTPAFQGISIFIGFLISLSSSSALSNAIAGTIITYTRAFKVGDIVRMGDAEGVVLERSLLVTRIRTPKDIVITVPNAQVLGGHVINFSEAARGHGIVLHTTVTIGYDVPWRRVHEALLAAAGATPAVIKQPAPFVLQTALNDFYVSYELNAYTRETNLPAAYSALHQNIQDSFAGAGIEIMSPHYRAGRDGNRSTIPVGSLP